MRDAAPIRAAQVWEGLSSCLATLAALAPGCRASRLEGATAIIGATDAAGNRLYVYAPDEVDTTVRSFVSSLRRRRTGASIIAGVGARAAVGALSDELGLRRTGSLPLLLANTGRLTTPDVRGTPAVVEPVVSSSGLAEMLALMALVLEAPLERLTGLYPTALLELPGVRAFVARRDGRPVSYVTTVKRDALTTVLNVGTHPGLRGRGEATALLAAVLAQSRRHGGELFALNAAPGATGLYLRLGFEVCDIGDVWQWGPGLQDGAPQLAT